MRTSPVKSSGDLGSGRLKCWGIQPEADCHEIAPHDKPNGNKLSGRLHRRAQFCGAGPLERVVRWPAHGIQDRLLYLPVKAKNAKGIPTMMLGPKNIITISH